MSEEALPRWLGPASRINTWLLRRGLRIGTQHVLSVPGRKSGLMRSTSVSLVTVDGSRYIVSGEGLAWVANARAAGWGMIERARRSERVALTECRLLSGARSCGPSGTRFRTVDSSSLASSACRRTRLPTTSRPRHPVARSFGSTEFCQASAGGILDEVGRRRRAGGHGRRPRHRRDPLDSLDRA